MIKKIILIKSIKHSPLKLKNSLKAIKKNYKNINFKSLKLIPNKGIKILYNNIKKIIKNIKNQLKTKCEKNYNIETKICILKSKIYKKIWTRAKGKNTIIKSKKSNIKITIKIKNGK